MKKFAFAIMFTLAVPLIAASAQAKGTPQNHHCEKDGATVADKTRKECTKEGGKWQKDAPTAAPAAAPAPADKKPAADAK